MKIFHSSAEKVRTGFHGLVVASKCTVNKVADPHSMGRSKIIMRKILVFIITECPRNISAQYGG